MGEPLLVKLSQVLSLDCKLLTIEDAKVNSNFLLTEITPTAASIVG